MEGDTVQVRDLVVKRGTTQRSYLKVGETPLGPIQFPLVVIHGAKPGPTLCLTAGVHAAEYPGIVAVTRIAQQLDPAQLTGTVMAVPVVNTPMYQARVGFLSPIDGLNLNRTFPGRPDGTISEGIAHTLLTEVVGRAAYHIDCHGGDLTEILWPYSGYHLTGKTAQDAQGEALARLYTPQIVALYQEGTPLPPTRGALTTEASKRGIVSILAECGSAGTLEPADVQTHMAGITNTMRFLGMIPGAPVIPERLLRAVGGFTISARRGGLVRLKAQIGDLIEEGQEIAEICDVFGDVVETIHSSATGIARIIWTTKVVNTGEPLVRCWVVEPAPPFAMTDGLMRKG